MNDKKKRKETKQSDWPDVNLDNLDFDWSDISIESLKELPDISAWNPDLGEQSYVVEPLPSAIGKSPDSVARWMDDEVKKGHLYHRQLVSRLRESFGDKFIYDNKNGNPALSLDVRAAFMKLNSDTVVWSRRHRYWRLRTDDDPPGREVKY